MSDEFADGWSCFAFQPSSERTKVLAEPPKIHWARSALNQQRKLWQLPSDMIFDQLVSIIVHGARDAPFAKLGIGRLRRFYLRNALRLIHLALLLPLAAERGLVTIWRGKKIENKVSGS